MVTKRAVMRMAFALGLVCCVGSAFAVPRAEASTYVGFSYFYGELSPYGRWVDMPTYGRCWTPYGVAADWRPYSDGYWVYTDAGWAWVDDEPWGWIPFHYGRWFFDSRYGWVWMPGDTWAPAWVAWRYSDDWIGWAPLPPEAGWSASFGLRYASVDRLPQRSWCFVRPNQVFDRNVRTRLVSVRSNPGLLRTTRDATWVGTHEGRPLNRGVDVRRVERMTGRRVDVVTLRDASGPRRETNRWPGRGAMEVWRPRVNPDDRAYTPAPQRRERDAGRPAWNPRQSDAGRPALNPGQRETGRPAWNPGQRDRQPPNADRGRDDQRRRDDARQNEDARDRGRNREPDVKRAPERAQERAKEPDRDQGRGRDRERDRRGG